MSYKDARRPPGGDEHRVRPGEMSDEEWAQWQRLFDEEDAAVAARAAATGAGWDEPPPSEKPRPRDYDAEFLSRLPKEEFDEWVRMGKALIMDIRSSIRMEVEEVDDDRATACLDICTNFLTQVVRITGLMLELVDVSQLRTLFAGDLKISRNVALQLKAAGVDLDEFFAPAATDESKDPNWRKRPRGSRHPLIVLLNLAVQSVRLIQRITLGTNPDAHNKPAPRSSLDIDRQKPV